MLSLFPDLLSFQELAPFLLRIVLGGILLYWAQGRLRARENSTKVAFAVLEAVVGFLLVIGLFTQGAALAAVVVFLIKLGNKIRSKAFFTDGVNYYFILLIIAVCLLLLGPGRFAFDLPL